MYNTPKPDKSNIGQRSLLGSKWAVKRTSKTCFYLHNINYTSNGKKMCVIIKKQFKNYKYTYCDLCHK